MSGIFVSTSKLTGEVIVYDLRRNVIVHEILDYTRWLAHHAGRDAKTISQAGNHLAGFWGKMLTGSNRLSSICDSLLSDYRDEELKSVLSNPRSRGSKRAAKSTVNQKLGAMLNWLVWLQYKGICPPDTIGPVNCRVTAWPARSPLKDGPWMPGSPVSSDLFLTGAGTSGLTPAVSRESFEAVREHIEVTYLSEYIASRDSLFVDVAASAGFRRGSICSLRTDQFDREQLAAWDHDTFPVTPSAQKFGYEDTFEIDTLLALRVSDFIEGPRKQLLEDLKVSSRVTIAKIFLSSKTGKPITDRSMTSRLGKAMRAIGGTKGQAVHAFRGLFANETIDSETDRRVQRGLDTSTLSIASATATQLGQRRAESLFPYVANHQSRVARKRLVARNAGEPAED